jgi:hypothetical protein
MLWAVLAGSAHLRGQSNLILVFAEHQSGGGVQSLGRYLGDRGSINQPLKREQKIRYRQSQNQRSWENISRVVRTSSIIRASTFSASTGGCKWKENSTPEDRGASTKSRNYNHEVCCYHIDVRNDTGTYWIDHERISAHELMHRMVVV